MFHFLWQKRRWAAALLSVLLLAGIFSPPVQEAIRFPGEVALFPGQMCHLPGGVTASVSTDETLNTRGSVLTARQIGDAEVKLSLFGLFPLHNLKVQVTEKRMLIPGGQCVGVGMQMEGVMVVGVSGGSGAEKYLKAGDTLLSVNGKSIQSADDLSAIVAESGGQPLTLACTRDGKPFTAHIAPKQDESGYRLGVWVRSSTAGVGTLTFFDPETGCYGALGHAVNDSDTGTLFSVRTGKLWRASVVDVKKGLRGSPGELRGSFLKENKLLGNIQSNTLYGVYGSAQSIASPLYSSGLPVGWRGSVHTGSAQILSTVDGGGVKAYDIEIVEVARQQKAAQKSFVIRVVDEELIEKTGGIVQGMSGSPVIQDGCLIGAVTHVFVDDPLMGYGLYIEWMLEEADCLAQQNAA